MTVSYCTTIWTHHQSGLCTELHKILGSSFKMVITLPLNHIWSQERIKMGWDLVPPATDWIVGPPATAEAAHSVDYEALICGPDVAVIGFLPCVDFRIIKKRVRSGKPTFFLGERLFKERITFRRIASPSFWSTWLGWRRLYRSRNVYFLTHSHWCKDDLKLVGGCRGRIYRWGYLTQTTPDFLARHKTAGERVHIGWCGRMIDWKCVDVLIRAYAALSAEVRQKATLTLVGGGDQEVFLRNLARELGVGDEVAFKPSMRAADALAFMRGLDVYVLPSNRKEGWGAALLEAMDSGCAVVANEAAGATLDLVMPGVNGLVFRDCDWRGLSSMLSKLIDNRALRERLSERAWRTVQQWSPAEGARRLAKIMRAVFNGSNMPSFIGLGERVG